MVKKRVKVKTRRLGADLVAKRANEILSFSRAVRFLGKSATRKLYVFMKGLYRD